MLRDRPAPMALWFSQPSWACRRAGRLGMAGKQGLGPPPPRPGCGVGPRQAEVPTVQLLRPKSSRPRQCLLAGGGRGRLQLPRSRPHIRTRAAPQAPTSDIYPPPGQLPVALRSRLDERRDSGINCCRPCPSQAETGPPRLAGILPLCTEGWSGHLHKCYFI